MSLRPMDSEYKRKLSPSLSLLTLAALTPSNYEVYIEDENVHAINLDDNPDIVGITVNVDTSNRAYEIATNYRDRGVTVILGGIHVSANPDEALFYADSICIGEAEEIWDKILLAAEKGCLKTKYYHDKPSDLCKVPIPKWNLLDSSAYLYTNIISSSRGCPFECNFCYNSCDYIHHSYRNRPIEKVVEEISSMNTKHVLFIDDNFIGNIPWTKKLIEKIKPLNLRWNAAVSTNIVHHLDLLDAMKESGCQSLFIGFETINSESIKSAGKKQNNIASYTKLIKEIHKRGIMINASLALGFDFDERTVFENTLEWLVQNKIETMTAHILTPYPGTKLYKFFRAEGRIIDYDWNHYNTAHVVFEPKKMSREELYDGYLWMYKNFYSFENILKRLPEQKNQWMSYLLFNLGYRKFGSLTSKLAKLGLMNWIGKVARRLAYGIE